jgi:predicted ester cyclase
MRGPKQRNRRVVESLFENVLNKKHYGQIPQYCTQDVVLHRPGNQTTVGTEAYENHYRRLHTALEEFEATLADVVAGREIVSTRFFVTGIHSAELLGIETTGQRVTFQAQIMFHLDEGEISEEYHQSDYASLRKQLK